MAVGQALGVGVNHFAHAGNVRGGSGGGASVVASDQHVHIASTLGGCGHGVEGGTLDGCVVVFGNH
jgi:hypothetical protein